MDMVKMVALQTHMRGEALLKRGTEFEATAEEAEAYTARKNPLASRAGGEVVAPPVEAPVVPPAEAPPAEAPAGVTTPPVKAKKARVKKAAKKAAKAPARKAPPAPPRRRKKDK